MWPDQSFYAFIFSTIKGKEEDALKIIGKKAYDELENTIFQLLDQQNFKTAASHKFSNRVHNDTVQKTAAVKLYELDRSMVPPYRAKTHREIFGRSPGGLHVKCESDEDDDEDDTAQKKGAAGNIPDYEREFQKKLEKMNDEWLYRESEYRTPAQKIAMEREWMERRRLLVEKYELKKAAAEEKAKKKAKHKRKDKDARKKPVHNEDPKTPNGKGEGEKEGAKECAEGQDEKTVVANGEGVGKEVQAVEKGAEEGPGEGEKMSKSAKQDSKKDLAKKAPSTATGKARSGKGNAPKDLFLAMEALDVGYEQGTAKEEEELERELEEEEEEEED